MGRTRRTRLIREAVRRLTFKKKTVTGKARAIYEFVNGRVRHRGPCDNAHQALAAGAGSREMLFLALAAAAGLEPCQGRTRKAPRFQGRRDAPATWELPSERHFTAELVGVRLEDGRILWMDLANHYMPFGRLRRELEGSRVLVAGARGAVFFDRLPTSGHQQQGGTVTTDLRIEAGGKLIGQTTARLFGSDAARSKARLAGLDATTRRNLLSARLNGLFRGANLTEANFSGDRERGTTLVTTAKFEVDDYLVPGPRGRLVCPGGVKPLGLVSGLAMDPSRQYPLKIVVPRVVRESLRYRLDPALEAVSLPAGRLISGRFGSYSLSVARTPGGFTVERRALILPQTIAPGEYPRFREFCRQVDEAEKLETVLRRRAPKAK